jgi:GxxExxY protein
MEKILSENELSAIATKIFLTVHKTLGPGLYESIYENAICIELNHAGVKYKRQEPVPAFYKGVDLDIGYVADIILEDKLIIELKSVDKLLPVHFKQLQSYLKLKNMKLGLLVNFNVELIKDGINRVVNGLEPGFERFNRN